MELNVIVIVIIYVIILLALIFSGMPIMFALGILGMGSVYLALGPSMASALGAVAWEGLTSYSISAIPLFVFMGYILFGTGLSASIYAGVYPLLDRLVPGGLLHSNIVVGAAFAACSGSSLASCATIGSVALPEMEARGYDRGIAAGSVAAGSTLGILIPPSITLIIYGLLAEESIGKLFIGGIIPGLILASAYMVYIWTRLLVQPGLVGKSGNIQPKQSWRFCLRSLGRVWPVLILIVGVLGSIYTGVATPTEAAAIGCSLAFILAASYRLLNWETMKKAVEGTVVTSSMILCIYLSGKLMMVFLGSAGITRSVARLVIGLQMDPVLVFIGIVIMYLILGMLMDALTMMITTVPIILPVIISLGFDTLWFGVILTMLCECALITPPVGFNLFILQGLRPNYPFMQIVKGCMPFFGVLLVVIAIMIAFPNLILFLPQTMIG